MDHFFLSLQLVPPNTESPQTQKSTETKFIDLYKMLRCHYEERGRKTYKLKRLIFFLEKSRRGYQSVLLTGGHCGVLPYHVIKSVQKLGGLVMRSGWRMRPSLCGK